MSIVTPPVGQAITTAEAKLHCRVDPDNEREDALIDDAVAAALEYCELEAQGSRQVLSATYNLPVECWWGGAWPPWGGVGFSGAAFYPHPLKLPRPPLQNVNSITYTDPNGNPQTLATNLYVVRAPWRMPGQIERAPNQVWPAVQADNRYPITIQFIAGYGPSTSIAAAIGNGVQTVTPASMVGIYAGTQLWVDPDDKPESVAVTAVTASTFTATFQTAHLANALVGPGIPRTLRRAILMLTAHFYENREATAEKLPQVLAFAVDALLQAAGYGGYA
jgi:hypothetical protein